MINDKIYKHFSNMGNDLTPYGIAIGVEKVPFLTPTFKFFKKEKIFDKKVLKTNKDNFHPFNYHVSNCGKHSYKKLRIYKFVHIMIRTFYFI